jgi:hypothetical protein
LMCLWKEKTCRVPILRTGREVGIETRV